MAKSTGLGAAFIVGPYNITGSVTSVDRINGGPAALDCTTIGVSGYERLGGVRTGGIEVTSWFDDFLTAPNVGEHTAWKGLPTADVQVSYLNRQTVGASAASCIGKQINYDGTRGNDGSYTFKTAVESNAFGVEWGTSLTTGVQTFNAAGNGTVWDDGQGSVLSTDFGLQLYVHLLAFTGTSVTVNIQDSTDNSGDPYTTITGASTAALTAVGTTRVATSATENVKRYLRVNTTGTFTVASLVVIVCRNYSTTSF